MISYTISGIGFLGAGVIMKKGMNARGLNTAATQWCSVAVGSCSGTEMAAEAATLTVFIVAGNTQLRPLINAINRIPLAGGALEATYSVTITTEPANASELRDLMIDHLELMRYPVADTAIIKGSDALVEITAPLVSTDAADADLDAVVSHLAKAHDVQHATWDVHTQD